MPEYRDPKVTDRSSSGGGAGRWIGIIIAVIIVLALLGWLFGWFGGADETVVETEQPAALEGEETVVEPEVEAGETLPQEGEVEESLEPEVVDDAEEAGITEEEVEVQEPAEVETGAGEAAEDAGAAVEETATEAEAAAEEAATEAEAAAEEVEAEVEEETTPGDDAPEDAEVFEVPVEEPETAQ